MDPKVALRQMVECMTRAECDEALEYALNVQTWINKGGFVPAMSREERAVYDALIALDAACQNAAASNEPPHDDY